MYSAGEALLRRWLREASKIVSVARSRLRSAALRSSTRTAPQGGLLVAVVGPDGGRQTLTSLVFPREGQHTVTAATAGGSATLKSFKYTPLATAG